MKTKLCLVLLCFLMIVPYVTASSAAVTKLSTITNDNIVQIRVNDVADLYGYEFKLVFDPSIIAVESIDFSGLNEPARIFYYELGIGYVHVAVCSLYPNVKGVDGNALLATIHFVSQESGTSPLIFEMSILAGSNGNAIPHTVENSFITVKTALAPEMLNAERYRLLW